MIKLMKLEMQKNRIGKYALRAGIMVSIIIAILIVYLFVNFYEGSNPLSNFTIGSEVEFEDEFFNSGNSSFFSNIPQAVTILMSAAFTLFSAAMLNGFVLGEYQRKTLSVMYTCPINRKTVFYAKFASVIAFSFCATVIATLLGCAVMFFITNQPVFSVSIPLSSFNVTFFVNLIFQAAASSFISLVPLMLGMIKRSTTVTIWSSIAVVILMQGTVTLGAGAKTFSFGQLAQVVVIPVALIILGITITVLTINKEVNKDLIL